ncbi:MAG: nuclear transport factor 2 family protein [marine benthic group bacterium]|nr:nuclear transport factor 2 family protein [Gemmatimonadota bacterium]
MRRIAIVTAVVGMLFGGFARPIVAQTAEDEVRAVVDALFDAMRASDSAAVRELFHPEMEKMASSGVRDGVAGVGFGPISGFVEAVGGAEPGALDEKIGPAEIRIDDNLATVFTPYAFHYNGNLSHCGVNVFLIARVGEDWRIVGLADTRRRQGCEEWLK